MSERRMVLELAGDPALARDVEAGSVFVAGAELEVDAECEVVLRGADGTELALTARVVSVEGSGVGLRLEELDAETKQRIAALAGPTGVREAEHSGAPAMHERLRGLPLAQQMKVAQHGEMAERIMLERLYGKNVWEGLLHNPRLTGPEVARIARMGALPRPLLEIVIGNGGWLQIPEVRRALLTNPRLGTDQALRVLRLLPKHELKLAAMQTVYPHAVRDAARRLLKELGG